MHTPETEGESPNENHTNPKENIMCELCLKQLRHEALEYIKCLYDFGQADEDSMMSEETYNQIITLHECMKTHELLKQIAEREEALYDREQRKHTKEHIEKMIEKWVVEEDIEEAKAKVEQMHKDQQVERLREELKTFLLNQKPDGWTKDQVELLTLDGLLKEVRVWSYIPLVEDINETP